jgi:hypothetical protein
MEASRSAGGGSALEDSARDWRERLPEEVTARREGFDVFPIVAKLAKAVEVLPLANAASDRRLPLLVKEWDW